jgi:hypothetical protein
MYLFQQSPTTPTSPVPTQTSKSNLLYIEYVSSFLKSYLIPEPLRVGPETPAFIATSTGRIPMFAVLSINILLYESKLFTCLIRGLKYLINSLVLVIN